MALIKSGPFAGLKRNGYRVITFDPPTRFETYSEAGQLKSASRHYETMSWQEIAALPVKELAHKDGAVLLMWATGNGLKRSMQVMDWLGFTYVSFACWVKLSKTGAGINIGTGYHFRDSVEPILIGRIGGKIPYQPKKPATSNVIVERVREHSRKPDQFLRNVEGLYRPPYLELFSRAAPRKNWTRWGDQLDHFAGENR